MTRISLRSPQEPIHASPRRRLTGVTWMASALASATMLLAGTMLAGLALAAPAPGDARQTQTSVPAQPASANVPGGPANPAAAPATKPATQPAGRPAPAVVPADPALVTDDRIDAALRKGADWLWKQFDAEHVVAGAKAKVADGDEPYAGGLQALAVYALMQTGMSIKDVSHLDLKHPEMIAKIRAMMKFDNSKGRHQTYAYGLRATALALYVTSTPDFETGRIVSDAAKLKAEIKAKLKDDAAWGVMATIDGSYTYEKQTKSPKDLKELMEYYEKVKTDFAKSKELPLAKGGYDNSNAQYGLLGVWSAAEAEVEIPSLYWYLVANHWLKKQVSNGTWIYADNRELSPNPITMTSAGMASMLVTHEYIEPAIMSGAVGREPYNAPIKKGLGWFETGDNSMKATTGYGIYGVERVGLASGFKFFGQHDWYKEYGARVLKNQAANGSWGNSVVETSYYLLFLARGRHPVTMNKLRFDGDGKTNNGFWANRPRDIANLTRSMSKQLERPLNWQVVNINTPPSEWLESPILTIGSHQPFKFSEDELARLRAYVEAGGMIYLQADGSAPAMNAYANQLCSQLFKRELLNVPPTHPLYTNETVFKIQPPVPLKMATNGSRVLMVYSSIDMAKFWQARDDKGKGKQYYQLGVNMYLYNAGKSDLRKRMESVHVPEVPAKNPPKLTVPVARLSYAAEWDPEPGAWRRFGNWFQWQTSYKVDAKEVKLAELKKVDIELPKNDPNRLVFAHLTGTVAQNWQPQQVANVKSFVESGGVLFVDVTGGLNAFDQSAQTLIRSAFPNATLQPIPADHPLLTASAPGMEDLSKRLLRKQTAEKVGRGGGQLQMLTAGQGAIIFSSLDVTSGLLGTATVGIAGYDHTYAEKLMKNAMLWALDGCPKTAAAPAAPAQPAANAK